VHFRNCITSFLLILVSCVEFESVEYMVSESSGSLEVILMLSGDTHSEPFNVTVIANDTGASSSALGKYSAQL